MHSLDVPTSSKGSVVLPSEDRIEPCEISFQEHIDLPTLTDARCLSLAELIEVCDRIALLLIQSDATYPIDPFTQLAQRIVSDLLFNGVVKTTHEMEKADGTRVRCTLERKNRSSSEAKASPRGGNRQGSNAGTKAKAAKS